MTGIVASLPPALRRSLLLLACVLCLACAHGRPAESPAEAAQSDPVADDAFFGDDGFVPKPVPDPLEGLNRPVFEVNMAIDRAVVSPLARVYGIVAPAAVRQGVRNFFSNLDRPVVFVNEILQLHPRRAAETVGRFALNSTLGAGGLLDPAGELGWEAHEADFGQTLGMIGVGPGLYLVFPLLGPSNARDAVGGLVDFLLRLDTWLLPIGGQLILGGTFGISEREYRREELDALRKSSVDFYAAVRSAYLQNREARVRAACRD